MTTYTPTDIHYDYAIGGLPFLSAAGQRLSAYSAATLDRQTAPYRKDQTDQSAEVGEQSLSFWWTRSQSSFHGGAGQRFLDGNGTGTDVVRHTRFEQSHAVDVWTPGQAVVLPGMDLVSGSTFISSSSLIQAYQGFMYVDDVANTVNYQSTLSAVAPVVVAYGGTGAITSLVSDGSSYYVSSASGVYKGPLDQSTAGAKICATTTGPVLAWVKSRLMAGVLNSLYVLDSNGTPTTALPTAYYTHPTSTWRWSQFAEGPQGIYAGGYVLGASASSVHLIGITVTTGTPALNAPVEVLQLPLGEQITGLYTYLAGFIAVASTRGLRIAVLSSDGTFQLGPLTLDGPPVRGSASFTFSGMVGQDRFLYVLSYGTSLAYYNKLGVIRVDLSNEVEPGRYAWAADMSTNTDVQGHSVIFDAYGNMIVGTEAGIWMTGTTPDANAFLITSRIRYSTSDPKIFERVRSEGDAPSGANGHNLPPGGNGYIKTLLFDGNGNYANTHGQWTPGAIYTIPTGGSYSVSSDEWRVEDSYISKVGQYVQVEFDFTESSNSVPLPDLHFRGYQLKSLPAQKRQRVERIPLMCFDLEEDQNRQKRGALGSAFGRLKALEALEEAGGVVTLQRFGEGFSSASDQQVVIDDIEFVQIGAPNKINGWGGVILLTVRTVD